MPAGREDSARAFYGAILGLTEVAKPTSLAPRGGVWLEQGNVRVHLGLETNFHPAVRAHPAFQTDEMKSLIVALNADGHAVTSDKDLPGCERVYAFDPFGNRIELLQVVG